MDSVLQQLERGQTPDQLDESLIADHQALELTFRRLMGKLEGGDPDTIRDCWCAMDRELEAHLHAEEKHILPHFGRQHPVEAAQLQREHAQIRATLLQLGVDLDLHSLREETAAQFISTLRQHAKSEELLVYRWARDHLPHAERHAAIEDLRAIRNLFRRPVPDARETRTDARPSSQSSRMNHDGSDMFALAPPVQLQRDMTSIIPAVRHYMTATPYSIGADQSLVQAHTMMREHSIRHLPVLQGGVLVGVVTARDLSQIEALVGTNPNEVMVSDAMSTAAYAVTPGTPLDRVVDEMASRKLGCAVVIEHERVVGIVTTVDVCAALYEVLHGRRRG